MAWRKLLLSSLLLAPMWVVAQSADEYFHTGVQDYIFGEKDEAKKEIVTGLQVYPKDPKLNGAWQLLQKKEEQQQQQQKQQQKQDQKDQKEQKDQQQQQQQNKDQKNQDQKDQKKQQSQKSDQQKKDEEKEKQEQAKKDQEKKDQEKKEQQAQAKEDKDKKDEKGEQASAASELRMSPQEARKLLDSQKDDSKILLFSPTNQPMATQPGKFKDW